MNKRRSLGSEPGVLFCGGREASTLGVWVHQGGTFVHTPQCIGEHLNGPQAIATGRIGFDLFRDFVAVGVSPAREYGPASCLSSRDTTS